MIFAVIGCTGLVRYLSHVHNFFVNFCNFGISPADFISCGIIGLIIVIAQCTKCTPIWSSHSILY